MPMNSLGSASASRADRWELELEGQRFASCIALAPVSARNGSRKGGDCARPTRTARVPSAAREARALPNPAAWLRRLLGFVLGVSLFAAAAAEVDPVLLTREHVDIRILYAPGTTNELYLVARDEDGATNYASTNVVLVVRQAGETVIPPGFEVFGEPGSPFWILPASQDPELLYLGVSAEGLPRGVFAEPLSIQLVRVQAPGWFFVWQFDPDGSLAMKMDSRDGIGPADVIQPIVGSHAHFNWGFSSNGVYEVTFRVEGRLLGSTTNLTAADTTFRFAVEPLPPAPPEPAFLSQVAASAGRLSCELSGTAGAVYRLQTSPDLVKWEDGPAVTAAEGPVPVSVPLQGSDGILFLRASAAGGARALPDTICCVDLSRTARPAE